MTPEHDLLSAVGWYPATHWQPSDTGNQLPSAVHNADCCVTPQLLLATQVPVAMTTDATWRPVEVVKNCVKLMTVALQTM